MKPTRTPAWPDIDPIAVDRMIMGDPPERTTTAERTEAIRRMRALGLPHTEVAQRMGMNVRNIQRRRTT